MTFKHLMTARPVIGDNQTMITLYFDNHATTALDPKVLEAMMPFFLENFGNAASTQHEMGWSAKLAVDQARAQVASLIGAKANEVIFTSGATESIHLAIMGKLEKEIAPRHIITVQTEHKATLEACARAKRLGHEVTILPVDKEGRITIDQVQAALQDNTSIVSIMHANNEIGTLHPIEDIGKLLRAREEIAFHVDAAQTLGKHEVDVERMGIDLLSLSSHKFHGPKGVGALYIRRSPKHIRLSAQMPGGGQEQGIRGGTVNVPGVVGLGRAAVIAKEHQATEYPRLMTMRDRVIDAVLNNIAGAELNGPRGDQRLANNINITFRGIDTDKLLLNLKGVAFSMASACSGFGGSHVLTAIKRDQDEIGTATLRLGLCRTTTDEQVTALIERLTLAVANARENSKT